MSQPDHNDFIQIQRQIHALVTRQNELQPAYSQARAHLSVTKDRKRRLLAKWMYAAPADSEVAKKNWALAQQGYLEDIGQIEATDFDCYQIKDEYEKIQPQLDMLRSEMSYAKAQMGL